MNPWKKIIVLLICLLPLLGCNKTESSARKQRQIEKQDAKKDEQALKDYQKAIKYHHKIQSKDTRKKMKNSRKESNRISSGPKKKFFLIRWFSRK